MSIKKVLIVIGFSVVFMIVMMFFAYDFNFNYYSISNVLFAAGIFNFLPGMIIVSESLNLFNTFAYLSRRVLLKPKGNHFKTFGDYMEYKNERKKHASLKDEGLIMTIIGLMYLVISLMF